MIAAALIMAIGSGPQQEQRCQSPTLNLGHNHCPIPPYQTTLNQQVRKMLKAVSQETITSGNTIDIEKSKRMTFLKD